jgi:hypothetical protein
VFVSRRFGEGPFCAHGEAIHDRDSGSGAGKVDAHSGGAGAGKGSYLFADGPPYAAAARITGRSAGLLHFKILSTKTEIPNCESHISECLIACN